MSPHGGIRRGEPRARTLRGFTLPELLVTIAIIGILALLLTGVVGKFREISGKAKSLSNLKQLAVANSVYMGEHNGEFPFSPLYSGFYGSTFLWQLLFPYVQENPNVFRSPADKRVFTPASTAGLRYLPGTSEATKKKLQNLCSYGSNDNITGGRGFFNPPANRGITRLQHVKVPLSTVVLFFDGNLNVPDYFSIANGAGSYTFNRDWPNPAVDRYGGGACFVFLDGHGAWLPTSEAPAEWKADFQGVTFLPYKN